jgi:Protein of unknown function (DUF2911)
MKKLVLISLATFVLVAVASAQMAEGKKPASPPASAQCKFSDGKSVKVDYSSPRAKGRKIFGSGNALVPYGEVWRTGANDATTFVSTANLNVGGKDVPAGNYTIFTVPNADKWTLIVNKKTGEWGIPYKYESDELGRVPMMVSKTSGPVENFTIAFDQAGSKCTLRMEWENTRASIDISEK